jgi:O-succinylbenzoic acid--CoA ligase
MIAPYWLERAARAKPDRPALLSAGRTWTQAELFAQAAGAAGALAARGVGQGDRVGLALGPGPEFVLALHGCLLLGAVAVPIDLRLGDAERAALADGCAVLVDEPLERRGGWRPAGGHDLAATAVLMHTSGTSAAPKPVPLTYGNLLWSALGSAVALGLRDDERWLCAMPLTHVGGLSILVRSAIYGTTTVLHERFDSERVHAVLAAGEATLVSLVATTLARLLDDGLARPPALRAALTGGGPVPEPLRERAAAAGIPVSLTYGLTEAASQVTSTPAAAITGRPAAGGPPLFCTRVQIAADGEILIAGPTVSAGALAGDGWLHTGDLGALDADGNLSVTGRAADTIVSGGENVAPAQVEAVLERHPGVLEAGVYGVADEQWGELVCARVVARDEAGVEPAALREFCAASLAGFKVPKRIVITREPLPRTRSGKLLRRELR